MAEEDELLNRVDRSELRQEAALFPWEHLTRDQKLAVLDAHRRFTMLAQQPFDPPKEAKQAEIETFLPSLERETTAVNRVLMIDGGRGSGKTVVLMRLLQYWSDRVRGKSPADEPQFATVIAEIEKRERKRPLEEMNPIVPIGFIQLALLDDSANLLTYLSAYLHQVIKSIEESRGVRSRPGLSPWTAVDDSGSRLSHLWNRYLQAIAHASNDQSSERKKTLDPQTWALELRDTEFQRRDVSDHFYELMNTLVCEFAANFLPAGRTPMFIIAIDDADMRPQQSVKLLNVLRQLGHPRVGFIMTGESQLFVRMLTESYLGRLRTPLRDLDFDAQSSQDQLKDRDHAARLARDVLDKVVPLPHRFVLPPLDEAERLDLMKRDDGKFNLLRFQAEALPRLLSQPQKRKASTTEERKLVEYFDNNPVVRGALPPRLRSIIAFREYLDAQDRTGLDVVEWLWQRAVDRADLQPTDQDHLRRCVRRKRGVAGLSIETFALSSSSVARTLLPRRRLRDRWSVALRDIDSYELTFEHRPLPDEVTAAFMLASDIAADGLNADFLGRSKSPNEFEVPFVTVSYAARDFRSYDFKWPLPDWDGFVDFEVFSARWRMLLHTAGIISGDSKSDRLEWSTQTTPKTMGRIARLFLGLAIDVCDARHEASIDATDRKWQDIANQLSQLSTAERRGTYRRNRHIVEWARTRAALLATPESGLSKDDANEFLDELQKAGAVDVDEAIRAREDRAVAAKRKRLDFDESMDVDVEELLKEIDSRTRDFKWTSLQRSKRASQRAASRAAGSGQPSSAQG